MTCFGVHNIGSIPSKFKNPISFKTLYHNHFLSCLIEVRIKQIMYFNNNNYQELANEICVMWKQNRAQVILLVISSTGLFPKSLSQSLKRLNLHPNTYIQMQKSVILETCSITRNFSNYK